VELPLCGNDFLNFTLYILIFEFLLYASVAELADAQGLGPCVRKDVEVRLLSLAVFNRCVNCREA
jgi:hypothetical protein